MDRHAVFMELVFRHQHDVRAFVASVIRDWHRVEDVMQEVMVVLWRRFDDYDPERPFGAWARGIASRMILKDLERHRRSLPLLSPEAIETVLRIYDAAPGDAQPRQEALRRCLRLLTARSRELVALRYGEDLSVSQLAARTGGSEAAIKKMLSRLRAQLQQCIQDRLAREAIAP